MTKPFNLPAVPLKQETRAWLSTEEVARHLGLTRGTLYRWRSKGLPAEVQHLSSKLISGRLMWPVAGLQALLAGG